MAGVFVEFKADEGKEVPIFLRSGLEVAILGSDTLEGLTIGRILPFTEGQTFQIVPAAAGEETAVFEAAIPLEGEQHSRAWCGIKARLPDVTPVAGIRLCTKTRVLYFRDKAGNQLGTVLITQKEVDHILE